ncbi:MULTISPECIES: DUF3152 domain-containing protein [Streptomyces]|uniref:Membrane protein n=1 Tax=Streptomyces viridochromogenes TaxID=1938 RepID=A0A0L8LEH6_STRVR|nr:MULTISPECIES: DUF3152 domain-containing protein [Streptomyces]KOG36633.1 membrane protein [Streptomyces viridochromogenes]
MGRRAAPAGRRSARRKHRAGPRFGLPAMVLLTVVLGAGAAMADRDGTPRDGAAAPVVERTTAGASPRPTTSEPTRPAAPDPTPPAARPRTTTPAPVRSSPPKRTAAKSTAVPRSGAGTFTTARSSGAPTGDGGTLRRYRVQVEDGIEISAQEAAAEIQRILAHPRGWAAHGRGRFQLVSENADFVIRIATPDTADALCLRQGLRTHGELNCETSEGVVVNLRRWMLGSPTFAGKPEEYRHLIINHEVGHEIGIRSHMGCPGPGRLAPAMMQQIKGLHGCRSNAFPYDEDGSYITGPIVS